MDRLVPTHHFVSFRRRVVLSFFSFPVFQFNFRLGTLFDLWLRLETNTVAAQGLPGKELGSWTQPFSDKTVEATRSEYRHASDVYKCL